MIFTGRPNCDNEMKSPIIMLKPPSPENDMTWRFGNVACAPMACSIAFAIEPWLNDPTMRRMPLTLR